MSKSWLIDGNILEHLRHPRCRIEIKSSDGPIQTWRSELIEFMGPKDPPADAELFGRLFAEAMREFWSNREEKT